ncbi:MAG: metal ABC transporter substrate-binding protein, partial [Clostridia bacterium]|nr:metal ABC transporter substrate-binding protein [Clostridia bacterium]
MMKKILSLALVLVLALGILCACGGEKNENVIKVGASSTPHAEILEVVKDDLKAAGYTLDIVVYDDYILPNKGVTDGELDANYFQHTP